MKRTRTFRLLPTNKKERFLEGLEEEMGRLANYVVNKYIDEIHGEAKLNKNTLYKTFVKTDSHLDLRNESDFIKKGRFFQSVTEKVLPNLKNFVNGRTRRPDWEEGCLHFVTRIAKFVKTDNGYWGVTIKHPSKREKIFIKLAENEKYEDIIQNIIDSGAEDTFTCEIHKNYNGKWMLSAVEDIGKAPDIPDTIENVVGIDLGLRFIATAAVMSRETYMERSKDQKSIDDYKEQIKDVEFFRGGKIFKKRKEINKRLSELQKEGHKKAYDRLKRKDGELMKNKNHEVSKKIVELAEKYKPCVIVFEDLEGSKDDLKEEKFEESGNIKGKAGRYRNRLLSFWSPHMLKEFTDYKAEEKSIDVMDIDPRHTSQKCPKCGNIDSSNRKNNKHKFLCNNCGYENNDDLVGAMNIAKRGDEKIKGKS